MRGEVDKEYDKTKNKAILFFTASGRGDLEDLVTFGIKEVLVSYHYIRKNKLYFELTLRKLHEEGGIFMTDSGAFSFMEQVQKKPHLIEESKHEEFWIPYLEEYVQWVRDNKDMIFCIANLDIDSIVGHEVVEKWNREYFEPLEREGIQVVYVAHRTEKDKKGIKRFQEYCEKYDYVGINQGHKKDAQVYYQIAKNTGTRVHGFAWTELELLKRCPFFSADSITWIGGSKYGITYDYDGKNFRTLDFRKKHLRKTRSMFYKDNGVDIEDVYGGKEMRLPINRMNLLGWMGFRKEFLKVANIKLTNKYVIEYDVRGNYRKHKKGKRYRRL